jgi:uncharacterized protein (TIGR02118 family)
MVKLVFCLHRLPHLTREQFQQRWRDVHAPLVAAHAATLGIRRYVQCHALADEAAAGLAGARGSPGGYDGVAELWFDSLEQARAARGPLAREAGRILLEDERQFIDLARSPIFFAEEHPIPPAP